MINYSVAVTYSSRIALTKKYSSLHLPLPRYDTILGQSNDFRTKSIKTNGHLYVDPSIRGVFFSRPLASSFFSQSTQSKLRSLCVHTFANTRSVGPKRERRENERKREREKERRGGKRRPGGLNRAKPRGDTNSRRKRISIDFR